MHKEYAKHIGADEYLLKWVDTVLKNELKRETKTTEEVEHILDYMVQCNKKVERMSYKDAKKLADAWTKTQQKKGNGIVEKSEDTEVVLDFKDGFKIVRLIGENAYKREGFLMSHCVGGYYGNGKEIYSLRDKDNMPHCTMEKDQQIKGKGNGDISPKYITYVVKFLEHVGMRVGDSEMKHLGYINVEKIKEDLHEGTKFFNEKYVSKDLVLLDKAGKEYFSPELFSIKPPLEYTDNKLKLNFNLATVCKLSFEWISNKVKVSKVSNRTAGDYAHSSTAGDSAHSSTTGNHAHSSTTGNHAHSSTAGDSAHSSTAGDSAHSSTTGYSAHSSTTGYSAHSSTAGDSAHSSTTGKNSIACALGIKNQAKASLNEWIVLTEWKQDSDYNWNISLVKSFNVDGKKVKADTWYKLENSKLVEVTN